MLRNSLLIALFLVSSAAGTRAEEIISPTVDTNIPQVKAFGPTTGLEFVSPDALLKMTNDELLRIGYPPRPDENKFPDSFAKWKRFILIPQRRIIPDLTITDRLHGPALISKEILSQEHPKGTTIAATSPNWSGVVIVDGSNVFSSQYTQVITEYVVPKPSCDLINNPPRNTYSSHWVGIDGFGSPDVFQAGTESDAFCPSGISAASVALYPWFEWFPQPEIRINNLQISPGDTVMVSVVLYSPTSGSATIEDMNTYATVAVPFSAPAGTTIQGNSIEWIAERPGINGSLSSLANYVTATMFESSANVKGIVYAPGLAPTGNIYNITMVQDSRNVSYGYVLDDKKLNWPDSIAFFANPR